MLAGAWHKMIRDIGVHLCIATVFAVFSLEIFLCFYSFIRMDWCGCELILYCYGYSAAVILLRWSGNYMILCQFRLIYLKLAESDASSGQASEQEFYIKQRVMFYLSVSALTSTNWWNSFGPKRHNLLHIERNFAVQLKRRSIIDCTFAL